MPITVLCPSCSSRITAPDRLAGKTAKCPKCQTAFVLPSPDPGFEVVEDDEPVVAKPKAKAPIADDGGFELVEDDEPVVAKPKAKPTSADPGFVVVEDDEPVTAKPKKKAVVHFDDDDNEEDEAPRRAKKRKKSGTPVWMYAGIAGAFLLVGLGVGLYFVLSATSWKKFDAPDGSFTAYFPGGTPGNEDIESLLAGGRKAGNGPNEKQAIEQMGMKLEGWSKSEGGRKYVIGVMTIPPSLLQIIKQGFEKEKVGAGAFGTVKPGTSVINETSVTVSGYPGKQILTKEGDEKRIFGRLIIGDGKVFMVFIEGNNSLTEEDANAKKFFEKFEINKK